MNLEKSIEGVIKQRLEDGTIEKLVDEQFQKGITNALENMFKSYGDVTKVIEKQIESVMVPYLESYDYSRYIVKLDSILTEVLEASTAENRQMLENFKELMTPFEEKTITATQLFEKWQKHVASNVETDGLDICYEDQPSYESVNVTLEVDEDENRSWSSFESANLIFECEHDEKMNYAIKLSRWKNDRKGQWDIRHDRTSDISSLRYLDEFEVFLMKITQANVKLVLDTTYENDDVTPDKEPEATFQ